MCSERFVINKGMDNEFVFTIKQSGETTAMEILSGDTFDARLVNLEDDSITALTVPTTLDALNGQIQLVIPQAVADVLVSEKGPKEDRYYAKSTYRLHIECDTTNNGNFVVTVENVYVR